MKLRAKETLVTRSVWFTGASCHNTFRFQLVYGRFDFKKAQTSLTLLDIKTIVYICLARHTFIAGAETLLEPKRFLSRNVLIVRERERERERERARERERVYIEGASSRCLNVPPTVHRRR